MPRFLLIVIFGLAVALAVLFFVVGGLQGDIEDDADELGAEGGARYQEVVAPPPTFTLDVAALA